MALQGSGQISLDDIHVEAGGTTGTNATINDADIRGLIDKADGATMGFDEWYGASNVISMTHVKSGNGTSITGIQAGDLILFVDTVQVIQGPTDPDEPTAYTPTGFTTLFHRASLEFVSAGDGSSYNWIKVQASYREATGTSQSLSVSGDYSVWRPSSSVTSYSYTAGQSYEEENFSLESKVLSVDSGATSPILVLLAGGAGTPTLSGSSGSGNLRVKYDADGGSNSGTIYDAPDYKQPTGEIGYLTWS